MPTNDISERELENRRLSARQEQILGMIHAYLEDHGYPPSVREIGEVVGLKSPSSVHAQLATLEEKGYLRRDPSKPRALEIHRDLDTRLEMQPSATRNVPLLGEIAAGGPIVAEEQVEALLPLPRDWVGDGTLFALRVRGESMLEAGIVPGDLVIIREQSTVEQGEMCAFLLDGEATVKFFRRDRSGAVWLDPANAAYEPIPVPADATESRVMGKVVSVFRSIR